MQTTPARWQDEIPATITAMSRAHYALLHANMELEGRAPGGKGYREQVGWIDAAVLALARGKWLYGRATGELADHAVRTSSAADLRDAQVAFAHAERLALASHRRGNEAERLAATLRAQLVSPGTEILYLGDIPIVPAIAPIVLLSGSSHAMGAQYARQCIAIFGHFIFSVIASRPLDDVQRDVLARWKTQLSRHTPEIVEMAAGLAAGARECGIAMDEAHSLALWTGIEPPASAELPIGVLDAEGGGRMGAYFGAFVTTAATLQEAADLCSACAVWGDRSSDGRMHYAATTDHDATFQVTIVAYPDSGLPFVYTPFSVNGSIPGIGRFGLAGHPGFNRAGLAYVHHGGGGGCEDRQSWGYGVPRGALTMNILRFSTNADEAWSRLRHLPTGDAGRLLGSTGGFFVDTCRGFVVEDSNPSAPLLREHQVDLAGRKHDVLYATNNLQSPEAHSAFCPPEGGYAFGVETGWYTLDGAKISRGSAGEITRRHWTASSESRNRFFYEHLVRAPGRWDAESLATLLRQPPQFGPGNWAQQEARLAAGERLRGSPAHRLNAFVSVGTPATGLYTGGIGPIAHRSISPNRPGHGYFYHQETSQMWTLKLEDSLQETVESARRIAMADIELARLRLEKHGETIEDPQALAELHARALQEVARAEAFGCKDADSLGQRIRCFTRAQIHARQVLAALGNLPALLPEVKA